MYHHVHLFGEAVNDGKRNIEGGSMTDSDQPRRYCTQCGAQVRLGNAFCVSCGKRIELEADVDNNVGTVTNVERLSTRRSDHQGQNPTQILVYTFGGILLLLIAYAMLSYSLLIGTLFVVSVGFVIMKVRQTKGSHTRLEENILGTVDKYKESARQAYEQDKHKELAKDAHQKSKEMYEGVNTRYQEWRSEQSFKRDLSELRASWNQHEEFFQRIQTGARYFAGWVEDYLFELEPAHRSIIGYLHEARNIAQVDLNRVAECRESSVGNSAPSGSSREQVLSLSESLESDSAQAIEILKRFRDSFQNVDGWDEYKEKFSVFLSECETLLRHEPSDKVESPLITKLPRWLEVNHFPDPHRTPGKKTVARKTVASTTFDKPTISTLTVSELLNLLYEVVDEADWAGYWESQVEIRHNVRESLMNFLSVLTNDFSAKDGEGFVPTIAHRDKLDIFYELLPDSEKKISGYSDLSVKAMFKFGGGNRGLDKLTKEVPNYVRAVIQYDREYGTEYCVAIPILVEHIGKNMSIAGGEYESDDNLILWHIANLRHFINQAGYNKPYAPEDRSIVTIRSPKLWTIERSELENLTVGERQEADNLEVPSIDPGESTGNTAIAVLGHTCQMAERIAQAGYKEYNEEKTTAEIADNIRLYILGLLSLLAVASGRLRESELNVFGYVVHRITGERWDYSQLREHVRDLLKESDIPNSIVPEFLHSLAAYDKANNTTHAAGILMLIEQLGRSMIYIEGFAGEYAEQILNDHMDCTREFLESMGVSANYGFDEGN